MKTINFIQSNLKITIILRLFLIIVFLNSYLGIIHSQCNNHWSGSSPSVSFELNGNNISNFNLSLKDVTCFPSITLTFPNIGIINGSFSYKISTSTNNITNSGTITGKLSPDGKSISGAYNIKYTVYNPLGCTPICCGTASGSWCAFVDSPPPIANAGPDITICAGQSVTLTATGGVSYSWTGGVINGVPFVPESTCSYTVTVTGANGCTAKDVVKVTVLPVPKVNAGADVIVCAGESVTLTAVGTGTISWDNGIVNGMPFAPTETKTYTATILSANSCSATDNVLVTVNPYPVADAGPDKEVCTGGSLVLTATGGLGYSWTGGISNGVSFKPTITATYTVTVTDANGCKATDDVLVTVNPFPTADAGPDLLVCAGESVILTALGGDIYSWSGGVTNGMPFTAAESGTYTVTVSTLKGCTDEDEMVLTVKPSPIIDAGSDVSVCEGESVTLSATGEGTIVWSGNIANGVPFTPGATNTYTATATGDNGCKSWDDVFVYVNPLPAADAGPDVKVCEGQSVTLSATGGDFYSWTEGITNGAPFIPTKSGTYTVTVTTAFGCKGTDDVLITLLPLPTVDAGKDVKVCEGESVTLNATGDGTITWNDGIIDELPFVPVATGVYTATVTGANGCTASDDLTVTVNPLPIANAGSDLEVCIGESVTLTASGGETFEWTGGITNGVAFTPTLTTTYTLSVTSIDGCKASDNVTVKVNPLPIADAGPDIIVCSGESVTLTATGGGAYSWTGGISNGVPFIPSESGNYTVTVSSSEGCNATDLVTVTVNPLPIVNAGEDVKVCAGQPVNLSARGDGTISWSDGVTNDASFIPPATHTYTVTVTNTNNCKATDEVTVTVIPMPIADAGPDVNVCSGNNVTLTATGGESYSWTRGVSNGVPFVPAETANYTVTVTNGEICTATDDVVVTLWPLPTANAGNDISTCKNQPVTLNATGGVIYSWTGGITNGVEFVPLQTETYAVTVTDANGCTDADEVLVSVMKADAGPDLFVCTGQSATLIATGGITYVWSGGISNGVPFTPLTTSKYSVTVTDANGCTDVDEVLVTVNPLPVANAGKDVIVCAGKSVTLNATGGNAYLWTAGVINGVPFYPAITATYTVTVYNEFGCTATDDILVTVNPLPVADAGSDINACAGESINLTTNVEGTIAWSDGVSNGVSFIPTETKTYILTVTNSNGCINTDDVTVTINPLPVADAGPDISVCAGESITLIGSGGESYSWSSGVIDGVPFIPEKSRTYTLTVTSSIGCKAYDKVKVTVKCLPSAWAGCDISVCAGESVTLKASGGESYEWTDGIVDGVPFIPTETKNYMVTVIGSNGCKNTDVVTVTVNPLPIANAGPDVEICSGESVTLTAIGGDCYSWTGMVQNGVSFKPTETKTYFVTVTSDYGCKAKDDVLVTVNPSPVANAGPDITVKAGQSVTLNATGGDFYAWTNGIINGVPFTPAETKLYTVTVTSGNGCTDTDDVTVFIRNYSSHNEHRDRNFRCKIYPNPVHHEVCLSLDDIDSKFSVCITSPSGKVFYKKEYSNSSGSVNERIKCDKLQKGLYFLVVKDGYHSKTEKFIVE